MGTAVDPLKKRYGPLKAKTLRDSLAQFMGEHFPKLGGPEFLRLSADLILAKVFEHLRPLDHVGHGQMLWSCIAVDDPPRRGKTTAQTRMVPVLLDVVTTEDIDSVLQRQDPHERLLARCLRLCLQAYERDALLSNCDLAMILGVRDELIARLLTDYQKQTGKIVPRRATVHDVGSGLTHKAIIVRKRFLEGKEPAQVARETYHTLEAVDHYLSHFDRVRCCRHQGMSVERTAYILSCSAGLVRQYWEIDDELRQQRAPTNR